MRTCKAEGCNKPTWSRKAGYCTPKCRGLYCQACGKLLIGKQKRYCSQGCGLKKSKKVRDYIRRRYPKAQGRQCRYCLAFDHEVPWYATESCEACARQRQRFKCPRCGGPGTGHSPAACRKCVPPELLKVILLAKDDEYDRERVIYRQAYHNSKATSDPRPGDFVLVAGGKHYLDEESLDQFVLTLPKAKWLRLRL